MLFIILCFCLPLFFAVSLGCSGMGVVCSRLDVWVALFGVRFSLAFFIKLAILLDMGSGKGRARRVQGVSPRAMSGELTLMEERLESLKKVAAKKGLLGETPELASSKSIVEADVVASLVEVRALLAAFEESATELEGLIGSEDQIVLQNSIDDVLDRFKPIHEYLGEAEDALDVLRGVVEDSYVEGPKQLVQWKGMNYPTNGEFLPSGKPFPH